MTYQGSEQSTASGKPIELYDLADSLGTHCRITSTSAAVTYLGHQYLPEPVRRKELKITGNHKKNSMNLELSRNNAFAVRYLAEPIEGIATLQIYRGHGTDFVKWWYGLLAGVKFDTNGVPELHFTPRTSSVSRVGRRRKISKLCDHFFCGAECRLNRESFKVSGSVDSVSGLVVTSTTFGTKSNDWFKAGMLVVGNAKRLIKAHTDNDVTITRPIQGLAAGASFDAYAGCAHTPAACRAKNNIINYGGEEFMWSKNPFVGEIW